MGKMKENLERQRWSLAEGLYDQFVQRRDIHARQLDDGRYIRVNRPATVGLMYFHLKGDVTLGTYLLDHQSRARFTVLDADDEHQFEQLCHLAWTLDSQDIPSYLETSRRGGHLWMFFREPVSGYKARGFGLGLLQQYGLDEMEIYPKQDKLVDGPGSLIRVPFGKHRKSGQRYLFTHPNGESLGSIKTQIMKLSAPETIPVDVIDQIQHHEDPKSIYTPPKGSGVEFLKSIPLAQFIAQYVELRQVPSGFVGRCPFHDDRNPSFGINAAGNYWNCFAGCGGGDIFSFWEKYRDIDFKTALRELEEMTNGRDANGKGSSPDLTDLTGTVVLYDSAKENPTHPTFGAKSGNPAAGS